MRRIVRWLGCLFGSLRGGDVQEAHLRPNAGAPPLAMRFATFWRVSDVGSGGVGLN